jgi:hypothetical protein
MDLNNEKGIATLLAMIVLFLLTMIGGTIISTSSTELQSATNDHLHKIAFYSAEAARPYVMMNPNFYGVDNIDPTTPHLFPNDPANPANPIYVPITAGAVPPFDLGNSQSFTGSVRYVSWTLPPRGSGYDTASFKAHQYSMTCIGNGPRNTSVQVDAGFYRIGL